MKSQMLDFPNNAGITAIAGVMNSGSPNCSIRAKTAYGVHAIRNAV